MRRTRRKPSNWGWLTILRFCSQSSSHSRQTAFSRGGNDVVVSRRFEPLAGLVGERDFSFIDFDGNFGHVSGVDEADETGGRGVDAFDEEIDQVLLVSVLLAADFGGEGWSRPRSPSRWS